MGAYPGPGVGPSGCQAGVHLHSHTPQAPGVTPAFIAACSPALLRLQGGGSPLPPHVVVARCKDKGAPPSHDTVSRSSSIAGLQAYPGGISID